MREINVIPVPRGMTPGQAWAEIELMGGLVGRRWWHRFTRPVEWVGWEVEVPDGD